MNTRLQVEHPITEATLGIDLVRWQIEVARGRSLPDAFLSGGLAPRGHAIELRLYAEDPVDFLPRSGTLLEWDEPTGPGVRLDSGVERGSVVGLEYDPLLAKLVVHAEDRARAIERAQRALAEWTVLGVETNASTLEAVLASQPFRSGDYATDIVASLPPRQRAPVPDEAWIAAGVALAEPEGPSGPELSAADPWSAVASWRVGGAA
jgi:acetyl-CoA/propionyl-CoA carboxylase biotin carboxyl carrier protein